MKKQILSLLLIMLLSVTLFTLTGCDTNTETGTSSDTKTESKESKKEEVAVVDDNSQYFVKVKGQTFKAGDKISDLQKIEIKPSEKVLDEKVNKNTYVIGAGTMYNADNKRVFSMTPFNATSETITVKDAVIGGFEAGEYQYDKIPAEVLDLDIEITGGIKLGSKLEDLEKVFGKTDNTYFAESLGYTTYTYKSKEIYRNFEFTVDKDGIVSKIGWKNLVFND